MFAIQVLIDDEWLYVTDPHPEGKEGERILTTFETFEEAKDSNNGRWPKYRIIELSDMDKK